MYFWGGAIVPCLENVAVVFGCCDRWYAAIAHLLWDFIYLFFISGPESLEPIFILSIHHLIPSHLIMLPCDSLMLKERDSGMVLR